MDKDWAERQAGLNFQQKRIENFEKDKERGEKNRARRERRKAGRAKGKELAVEGGVGAGGSSGVGGGAAGSSSAGMGAGSSSAGAAGSSSAPVGGAAEQDGGVVAAAAKRSRLEAKYGTTSADGIGDLEREGEGGGKRARVEEEEVASLDALRAAVASERREEGGQDAVEGELSEVQKMRGQNIIMRDEEDW